MARESTAMERARGVGVEEVVGEALAVAVEEDADLLAGAVDDGAAGVAAGGVEGGDEVEWGFEVEGGGIVPAVGEDVGVGGVVGLFVLEGAGEGGPGGEGLAVLFVAFNGAEGEAECAGGVGVFVGSVECEAGAVDFGEGAGLGFGDGGFELFAEGRFGVDGEGELDHGIGGRLDLGGGLVGEEEAFGGGGELGVVDELCGALGGGLAGEDFLDRGIGRAEGAEGVLEELEGRGEFCDFEVGVSGDKVGVEVVLEFIAPGGGEFGEAFAVGFLVFGDEADDGAGVGEERGAEGPAVFEEGAAGFELLSGFFGGGDGGVGGVGLVEFGVGAEGGAEEVFALLGLFDEAGLEGGEAGGEGLAGVLDAEEVIAGFACGFVGLL